LRPVQGAPPEAVSIGFVETWIGRVYVVVSRGDVTLVSLVDEPEILEGARSNSTDPVLREALRQLDEYFRGSRRSFVLPVRPVGTPFQLRVWRASSAIRYGETRTYAEVARSIGVPSGARAVGSALSANPLPVLIPCHRVVRSDGGAGGYSPHPRLKVMLLRFEAENAGKEWSTGTGRSSASIRSMRS